MPGGSLDGRTRSKLREAILAGFNPVALDETLRDNDMFRHNIATGPDFLTRVNSLIDVAHQEGWLAELCDALAAARARNQEVSSAIRAVRESLIEKRETPSADMQFQSHASFLSNVSADRPSHQDQTTPGEWAEFFFSFKGRLSRRGFWLGFGTLLIVNAVIFHSLGLLLGDAAFEMKGDESVPTRLYKNISWLMAILLYWPLFAVIVKRLHDFGQGKTLAWVFFVFSVIHKIYDVTGPEAAANATLAIFFTILFVIGSIKGIPGPNKYGPDPLLRQRKWLTWRNAKS